MNPDDQNYPIKSIEDATHMFNVIGLAFDFDSDTIFFSDLKRGDIQKVKKDGTGFETVVAGKCVLQAGPHLALNQLGMRPSRSE
jgi:hypothetical protein